MLSSKNLEKLYYYLLLPRFIENKMLLLLRQGKISKWFSGIGQEAISVGATFALNKEDYILPMHRNLGVFTTRELNMEKLLCQLFGRVGGYTKGRDRTFHFGDVDKKIVGMISHLAAMLPVANGLALSFKLNKKKRIALAFIGDGATSEGDFHEALNLAAVWELPVIFLIENNGYGLSTPVSEQYKCKDLAERALGYGIEGKVIDGNNILEVYSAIKEAADKIKKTNKPMLIEAKTFRMRGHEEASGVKYIPKELFVKWEKKDPIKIFENYLKEKKILTDKKKKQILKKIEELVNPHIDKALNKKKPTSNELEELKDVYESTKVVKENSNVTKSVDMRFVDAIKDAMYQKLLKDDKVLIMGQDIAEYGGVFKATEKFVEKFGKDRIRNTPITESAVIGSAMGLSIEGYRPIVEMQFADFVSDGFNQIVNNLAKTYYRWGQPINVTLRMPTGGGIGAGPFHSQNTESWFFHVPGLKIVYPSSSYDAKGLLISSIEDPNPVLYFEHKKLYRSISGKVPIESYSVSIGEAKIVKKGVDLSIITYGLGVHWALEFSKKSDYDIEILDLRTLMPLDTDAIFKTVKKNNRVLILHEDNITGGIGAELSSLLSENCFEFLDAPILRLGSIDTPTPFTDNIENDIFFPVKKIEKTINKLMSY